MRTPVRNATQEGPRELSFRDGTVRVTTARVLVVWVGYNSGPWAVRSLRDAGYDVLASHPEGTRGGRSTAALDPRRYPSPAASPDAFMSWLEETCRAERISAVLALDPDAIRLIAERAPDLSGAVFAGPTADQYRALCEPAGFARSAVAAGVDAALQVTGRPWELHCVRGDGGFAMVAGRVELDLPPHRQPRRGGPDRGGADRAGTLGRPPAGPGRLPRALRDERHRARRPLLVPRRPPGPRPVGGRRHGLRLRPAHLGRRGRAGALPAAGRDRPLRDLHAAADRAGRPPRRPQRALGRVAGRDRPRHRPRAGRQGPAAGPAA